MLLPTGNTLNVTYVGMKPHIIYGNPPGGGDFKILDLLAAKHGFGYIAAVSRTFGWSRDHQTGKDFGAVYHVASRHYDISIGQVRTNTRKRNFK